MPDIYLSQGRYPSKKRRWRLIQSLFFIFIFSLAIYVFFQSPFFNVKDIIVSGNKVIDAEDILELSDLSPGINIFKANLNDAQSKVALHPIIKDVQISRDFPSTVRIDVIERKQVALVPFDGFFGIVSGDGYYISKVDSLSTVNLPIITGVKSGFTEPGREISDERLRAALSYLLAMPLNIRASISEINVEDLNNIRVYTIDKVEIRFGDGSRVDEKIKLYQEVITQKYNEKIQYIDISYKGNPVIKFMETSEKDEKTDQVNNHQEE